jgi:hypothetical protein
MLQVLTLLGGNATHERHSILDPCLMEAEPNHQPREIGIPAAVRVDCSTVTQ